MQLYEWNSVEKEKLNPTFARQVINGQTMTVARIFMYKGCLVPLHSHENEQITVVEQGELKFVVNGKEQMVKANEVLVIPPHAPHSAEAVVDSVTYDIFCPVREDWRNGTDAYLRR
jgi:quercetin dioxygenase-like cupin family protein